MNHPADHPPIDAGESATKASPPQAEAARQGASSNSRAAYSKLGFVRTYVLPSLLVFLVPTISFFFFRHAQHVGDVEAKEALLLSIQKNNAIKAEEKARIIEVINDVPFSKLIQNENIAADFSWQVKAQFATYRWMIWLSKAAILSGVVVYAMAGLCVLFSLWSQRALYVSLSVGWEVLRCVAAFQTAAQGAMLVALSFWVTALWTRSYYPKVILCVAILVGWGIVAMVVAFFKKPSAEFPVDGQLLDETAAPRLWEELRAICTSVGADEPDQIVVGIDDNFFVTESPIRVGETTYQGRTLFVSLALLKHLHGSEADAVLAHEMAHFSGNDTLYSKLTAPLLNRFDNYLLALHQNPITKSVFYYMNSFRALFELALKKHAREREFRADRIAGEVTSSSDLARALVRISSYSNFREKVQTRLLEEERPLAAANIAERIESGYHSHAATFVENSDMGTISTSHPFDSHPPLAERLQALGVPLESHELKTSLAERADGRWYDHIDHADSLEREGWMKFEEMFKKFHEEILPYRFIPSSDEERVLVAKAFPEITIEGKKGNVVIDHESAFFTGWPEKVKFADIENMTLTDDVLHVRGNRPEIKKLSIKLGAFNKRKQEVVDAISRYHGRYLVAKAYQEQKQRDAPPA